MNGPVFIRVLARGFLVVSCTSPTKGKVEFVVQSGGNDREEETTRWVDRTLHQAKVFLDWAKVVADNFRMTNGIHFVFVDEWVF